MLEDQSVMHKRRKKHSYVSLITRSTLLIQQQSSLIPLGGVG